MRASVRGPGLRQLALALGLASVSAHPALAGAWLQPEGQGQIIFSPSVMFAKQRFDKRGRGRPADRFVKSDNIAQIEYGFRENLTLLVRTEQRGEAYLLNGDPQRVMTSAIGGGARIALWRQDRFIVSFQATAQSGLERSIPTLDRRFGSRHEADARVLTGFGGEVFGMDVFAESQAGYRWRSGRHADEVRLDLTLGLRPLPRLLVLLQSVNSLALQRVPGEDGRQRRHKLQASAVLDLTDTWSVQAGVFGSMAGRNALKERGVVLGVWRKF
jgi:protein XagA